MAEIEKPIEVTINPEIEVKKPIEENRVETEENRTQQTIKPVKPKRQASDKQKQALQKARETKKINQKVNKIVSSAEIRKPNHDTMRLANLSNSTYMLPIIALVGVGGFMLLKKKSVMNMQSINENAETYSRLDLNI
jgi:hypothetical protein